MINRLSTVEMSFKEFFWVNLLRQDVVAVSDHLVLGGEEAEQLDSLVPLPLENWVMLRTNQWLVLRCPPPIRGECLVFYLDHHHGAQDALLLPRDPAPVQEKYIISKISSENINRISLHRKYR